MEITDGGVCTEHYSLTMDRKRLVACIAGPDGRGWLKLRMLSSVDCVSGPDETVAVGELTQRGSTFTLTASSTRWQHRNVVLRCTEDSVTVENTVAGTGSVTFAHLLGGWYPPGGFRPSGSSLGTVVSPNPDHPSRIARPAVEPATIGVVGEGSEPGVGHWLFTPAPWCFALSREAPEGAQRLPSSQWAGLGLAAPIEEQNFTQLHYLPVTDGFSLRLDYEGHTTVDGEFALPPVVLRFGASDPYQVIADHREVLRERGLLPAPAAGPAPAWWREPIFCGWGAQVERAAHRGGSAQESATQAEYDGFLATLAERGLEPGTITVDDKWHRAYATCRPDTGRWPDLRGWIDGQHAAGRRVLLWWKAWDPEGAPAELCVRTPDGRPVALDPGNPACRELIAGSVRYMLGPDGLNADGLKIDFTARTPSGVALRHHGPEWGARLLHLMLSTVYGAAKGVRPDALIITHCPNPAFTDVTDMIRLNDALMLDAPFPETDVAAHMGFRARVVAAACPGVPVDTDGWAMPDRAQWRAYLETQPSLGVPSLYYLDGIGGERFTGEDYAALREVWARYRETVRETRGEKPRA